MGHPVYRNVYRVTLYIAMFIGKSRISQCLSGHPLYRNVYRDISHIAMFIGTPCISQCLSEHLAYRNVYRDTLYIAMASLDYQMYRKVVKNRNRGNKLIKKFWIGLGTMCKQGLVLGVLKLGIAAVK